MSDSRRYELEIEAMRRELERTNAYAEQLAAAARRDDATEITRIGVDLIELRRQFDALVHRVVLVESRIVEIAAAAAAITRMLGDDAVLRASRQRLFNWFIGAVVFCMALLLAFAGVIMWRLW
jgi:hypothetical protein